MKTRIVNEPASRSTTVGQIEDDLEPIAVCPGCWVCRQLDEPAIESNRLIHCAPADIDPTTVRLNVDVMGSGIVIYARRF
ncbi:hypothetical protein [Magnetospirillum molischianum]|nr:hypothetical protein [Magnetospirillum molischianum]